MEKVKTSYKLAEGRAMWMDRDAEGRKTYSVGEEIQEPIACTCYSQKAAIEEEKMFSGIKAD